MSRTWKDISVQAEVIRRQESRAKAYARERLRRALAWEKARHEVMLMISTGKLQAKHREGRVWTGKVEGMARALSFDLDKLILLRANAIYEASR